MLHLFGFGSIVQTLLCEEVDPKELGGALGCPLFSAVEREQKNVISLLLDLFPPAR
jgi:hypothetical protein